MKCNDVFSEEEKERILKSDIFDGEFVVTDEMRKRAIGNPYLDARQRMGMFRTTKEDCVYRKTSLKRRLP